MSWPHDSMLGSYEILGPLGVGGMGEVYRARDPRLQRDVAIKTSAQRFSERFEREARAIAALNHPNIAQIYGLEDGVTNDGVAFRALAMELVPGGTLADVIASARGADHNPARQSGGNLWRTRHSSPPG